MHPPDEPLMLIIKIANSNLLKLYLPSSFTQLLLLIMEVSVLAR